MGSDVLSKGLTMLLTAPENRSPVLRKGGKIFFDHRLGELDRYQTKTLSRWNNFLLRFEVHGEKICNIQLHPNCPEELKQAMTQFMHQNNVRAPKLLYKTPQSQPTTELWWQTERKEQMNQLHNIVALKKGIRSLLGQ